MIVRYINLIEKKSFKCILSNSLIILYKASYNSHVSLYILIISLYALKINLNYISQVLNVTQVP